MAMVGSNSPGQRIARLYVPLALYGLFLLFPFLWMLIVSLKPDQDLLDTRLNPFVLTSVTFDHYRYLFEETEFLTWAKNTAIVTFAATAVSLACSVLIGYALGRLRFRGGNFLGVGIFLAYLVPPTLLFIPLSQVIARFHLYNKYWALIFTYPTFLIPFAGWLLMGYFRTISRDLEDAALVDGATRLQAMWQIVLPLALPGVLSAGIFCFTLGWNEFLYALVFMGSGEMKTIPVGVVSDLIRADVYFWGSLMAAGILGSVPVAVAYSFFVDNYVAGLTAGATKG
ncbi:MAG: multiple sugar transport system permease protein [Thermomicrobiales bacterium]|jgi:multiple sugar transport system permease protein|nr:multiple sugar transport system permease protein [Thermomicrobiales bacterium]MEA2526874.1 multiple sugar transport system permease protein [Thermomicrobiales bacterium]MEA2586206.1 multiple sugar transport system permease protein [Thermomicrobiales bacterium]